MRRPITVKLGIVVGVAMSEPLLFEFAQCSIYVVRPAYGRTGGRNSMMVISFFVFMVMPNQYGRVGRLAYAEGSDDKS